jgi:hypothetical protein
MDRASDFTRLEKAFLHQKAEVGEEVIQNCFPCIEFENTYKLYTDPKKEKVLVTGRERSNLVCRWCLGPSRGLTIDWKKGNDTKFTTGKPFRCFRCPTVSPLCQAAVYTSDRGADIGHAREDYCTCFTPSFTLYNNKNIPYARVKGPACFGGIFEACSDSNFRLEEMNGRVLTNVVEKGQLDGKSAEEIALAALGDSDDYRMKFPDGATNEEKANIISTLILLDYMLFEGDKSTINGGCYIGTFYCMGCVCPITCPIGNGTSSGASGESLLY